MTDVFWISIIGLISTTLALSIRYCFKSKCDKVNLCCGCVTIHRDTSVELKEDMEEMKRKSSISYKEMSSVRGLQQDEKI